MTNKVYYVWKTVWEEMDVIDIGIGSIPYTEPRVCDLAIVASSEPVAQILWHKFVGVHFYYSDAKADDEGIVEIMETDEPVGTIIHRKSNHPACRLIQGNDRIPQVNRFYAWRGDEPLWVKSVSETARYILMHNDRCLNVGQYGCSTGSLEPDGIYKSRSQAYEKLARGLEIKQSCANYGRGTQLFQVCEVHFTPDGGMYSLLLNDREMLSGVYIEESERLGVYFASESRESKVDIPVPEDFAPPSDIEGIPF